MTDNKLSSLEDEVTKEKPKGFWRPILIFITLLVITGLILLELFPRLAHFEELKKEAEKDPPPPLVKVLIATPNLKQIDFVLPSYLQAINITPLWARTNGYVKAWYVDIGDRVKAGQLLADIETPEVDQSLEQSRADLINFKAQLEIARISAERWQVLYQRNSEATSRQEVDEKTATFNSAKANVNAAEANVKRLEALQGFNKIYAPFDGIIIKRDIDIGSLVTSGSNGVLDPTPLGNAQELFQIAKIDILRAFVDVPQSFYRLVKDKMEAQITVKEHPGEIFKGIIARTAGSLDPVSRTLLTQVNIDNAQEELLPGLYAEVKFSFVPDTLTFIIPTSALIIRSGPPYVAIVDKHNQVRLQQVSIGLDLGKTLEITSGIKEHDVIIVNPGDRIKNGVVVEIASTNQSKS